MDPGKATDRRPRMTVYARKESPDFAHETLRRLITKVNAMRALLIVGFVSGLVGFVAGNADRQRV